LHEDIEAHFVPKELVKALGETREEGNRS
jgi:hypothetical protein